MRLAAFLIALTLGSPAFAQDKLTLILDWFVNPDHGPIVIAEEKGFFAEQGLEVEVIAPDVGGGFGVKIMHPWPEEIVVPMAAMRLGRPVKWTEDRREHFISSAHERGQEQHDRERVALFRVHDEAVHRTVGGGDVEVVFDHGGPPVSRSLPPPGAAIGPAP